MKRLTRRRLWALVVLTAWIGGLPGSAVLPHTDGPDIACGEISLASGAPALRIDAARTSSASGHCALCHLQRVVRSAVALSSRGGVVVRTETPGPSAQVVALLAPAATQLPSRGPPSRSL